MRYYCESKTPCPYYHQFRHFIPSGAIIMNSMKWEAETWMLRKPKVAVEIIDEGDAFLDSIAYKTNINRRTFQTLQRENLLTQQELDNLEAEYLRIFINHKKSMEFELTSIPEILSFINFLADLLLESDSSVLMDLQYKLGIITSFKDYAWVHVENTEQSKTLTFYIPRMDITLDELRKRSGKLVFMSATSHSDENYRNIYNIMPKRVYAQERNPGTIYLMTPEVDRLLNVSDRNWKRKGFKEYYWRLLDDQLKVAARPCYVLVHARRYLPPYYQPMREEYGEKYWCRDGLEDVFFSTKMDRGIDLKDDLCRSIVLLKYPIPYLGDVVLKTIRKQYGEPDFWKYVLDLANRELLQQCGRAVRNRDDWCEIYSPDQNVIYNLQNTWIGKLIEKTY